MLPLQRQNRVTERLWAPLCILFSHLLEVAAVAAAAVVTPMAVTAVPSAVIAVAAAALPGAVLLWHSTAAAVLQGRAAAPCGPAAAERC